MSISLTKWLRKLSQFNFYHDEWIDVKPYIGLNNYECRLPVNLKPEFFESLQLDAESVRRYRIEAAIKCYASMGSKPALCFSGGIDSQATWQCFNEAGIDIDVYTLVFKDGLNTQDVEHAVRFAKERNFELKLIEIDIINFLSRENYDYSIKYKSLSPHFNTHYKLCDMLISKGYTGFVCGGGGPILSDITHLWCVNYSQNFLNYIHYSLASGVYCQGNFLGFYPQLAWAIGLFTPILHNELYGTDLNQEERNIVEYQRYLEKIHGYTLTGFNIIPQEKKYTGFELVKEKLEEIYGDGWAFEKLYRMPLRDLVKEIKVLFDFDDGIIDLIKKLNIEKSRPSLNAPAGIGV
jgi:hypothetical protein